ncbi:hypothetical protein EVAR_57961_1 [Eumeta japonica]|uniref:Tc1-like transposase DDE domain-containing protein n=1 Tax=Eumeta variegata TaxID=151549 RepID=A0A4C1Y0D9_EUMVA|nr:hypothetical protein EVAR_57961_1 [Eumeta japonica]
MRLVLKHVHFKCYPEVPQPSDRLARRHVVEKVVFINSEAISYRSFMIVNFLTGHKLSKAWVDIQIETSKQAFLEGLTTGLKAPTGKGRVLIISHIAVDKLAAEHCVTSLRPLPCHCELNPIELVWAQVKGYVARNNKTFMLNDIIKIFEEGLKELMLKRWSDYVKHVKEEDKITLRLKFPPSLHSALTSPYKDSGVSRNLANWGRLRSALAREAHDPSRRIAALKKKTFLL